MPTVRATAVATAALVGAFVVAACGGTSAASPDIIRIDPRGGVPATLDQLLGPWQPIPYHLDPALAARIETACRRDMQMPPGGRVVVMDARGEGVVTVRISDGVVGQCDALEITRTGDITGAGGGMFGNGQVEPPIAADGLGEVAWTNVTGGNLRVQGWEVLGRIGPDVARVEIVPAGAPTFLATVGIGWFSGWWPARINQNPRYGLRGYDAAGNLLFRQ